MPSFALCLCVWPKSPEDDFWLHFIKLRRTGINTIIELQNVHRLANTDCCLNRRHSDRWSWRRLWKYWNESGFSQSGTRKMVNSTCDDTSSASTTVFKCWHWPVMTERMDREQRRLVCVRGEGWGRVAGGVDRDGLGKDRGVSKRDSSKVWEIEKEGVRETQLLLHNRFSASTVPGQNTINTSVRGVSGIRHSATALSGLRRKCPGSFGEQACPRTAIHSSGPFCGAASLSILLLLFCVKIKLHMISNVSGPPLVVGRRPPCGSDNRYILCLSCGETLVCHSPVTRHCHTVWSN